MSRTQTLSRDSLRLHRPILLAARFSDLMSLRRQRARLARLDAAALKDIGLTRDAAEVEANRPLWDVPATWRC